MRQLVYASKATKPFTVDSLRKLLEGARRHNSTVGVTGMLLHVNGAFLQVLEGEQPDVDALYTKIELDPRHGRVLTLIARDVEQRNFADWSMGFVDASHRAASMDGYRATNGFSDLIGDTSAVTKIIDDFRGGRWGAAA